MPLPLLAAGFASFAKGAAAPSAPSSDRLQSTSDLAVTSNPVFASPFTVGFGESDIDGSQDLKSGGGMNSLPFGLNKTIVLAGVGLASILGLVLILRK